jgi:outer membrane receptor for ferric coprogen and ferric-rhodotorulic acid
MQPRVTDNDKDEITVSLNGREIRGWSYATDDERRLKMQMAHEFAEGWFQATEHHHKIAEEQESESGKAAYEYDGGAGSAGYEQACRDISTAIRPQERPAT